MIVIELDKLGLDEALKRELDKLEDLTPLMRRVGNAAQALWAEKFRREGPGWAPLAESTLARRRKSGKGAQILRDGGTLFSSLTSSGTEGSVYRLEPKSIEIGTNLVYGRAHQFGTTSKSGRTHIPKRPFMPTTEELEPIVSRILERYFEGRR